MFNQLASIQTSSSVLSISVKEDRIAVVTNQYLLLIYDKNSFSLIDKKQISTKYSTRHIYEKSFIVSSDFDILITSSNSSKSFLLKLSDSLIKVDTIETHKKPISYANFNNSSNMLLTGGEDGKVFFYSLNDKKIVKSLPSRPDYISDITFSKDDKFASISSFDKSNSIYSFDRGVEFENFKSDEVVVKSLFLENNSKLYSITKDKKLIYFDLDKKITTKAEFEFDEWPTTIIEINSKFIIVGTKGNKLYLIDHTKNIIVSTLILDNSGIVTLEENENRLYIGFTNGEIKVINIKSNLDQFVLYLKLNKFEDATKLIEKNIFLITDESVKKFDQEWPNILSDAKKLITSNNKTQADRLVTPFFFDNIKKVEYLFCLGHMDNFNLFTQLIEEKEYIEAFKLADEFEFLKKSKDFDSIEKHFLKIFQNCKLLFVKGDIASITKAKESLKEYATIRSKAVLINNLLTKYKLFVSAEKLIKERNFKNYFLLVKQNKFLEDEEIYNRVILIANQTFSKLNLYEQEGNYEKAIEVAEYMKDFLPFKQKAEDKIVDIKKMQLILKNIEDKKVEELYKLIDKESKFQTFKPFIEFHENFLLLIKKAHNAAKNADVKSVSKILNRYINIDYTIHIVAQEFKTAYLAQIEKEITEPGEQKIDWVKSIKLYDSMFGLDDELNYLLEKFGFHEILSNIETKNKFDGYTTVKFFDTILVLK